MRSIKTKLIISSSLMILAAILIVAIPTLRNQYSVLNENITENASLQILEAADSIDAFFNTPKTIVKDTSYYVLRSDLDIEKTQKDFENIIKGIPALFCLYYADEKPMTAGGIFYSSDGWIPKDDYDKDAHDWYADAKKVNKTIITEPYVDESTGHLVSTIATSVRENGAFRGVVGIDVFLSDLNAMMERIKLTKDGKTFLIDANGYYLTNEDASKVQNAKFFDEYSNLTDYKNKINTSEVFLETRAAGGNYIAGTIINKDAGWLLVTVGSTSAIFAKLQHNIILVIVMAVIAQIVSVIIGIIVSSSIVKPIKVVDTAVNGIAEGNANLTHRLKASSRDEVGHLVNGFNKFMEKLHGIVSDVKSSKNNLADVKIDLQESIDSTASAITEILSNIESVGGQVSQQVASVTQTSAAVTEIAENINSLEKMISTQSDGVTQASAAVE
ncbi:MAG: methyl-accepting chemotaxis protein, partial [Treponema sp.]|nr:methyl-accepting chemotaxis protein [Treponema sp.]